MLKRLGLGKQTNLFRAGLLGWLYRHDWQLAGLLAVATVAAAAFVLWPRSLPTAATPAPAVISADGFFHTLPNVVMTPHMSGWTLGTIRRRQQTMADNIRRRFDGRPCINIVRPALT